MNQSLATFKTLVQAEEYFQFFGLPYDPVVVNVNRLHILRKFSQFMQDVEPNLSPEETLSQYKQALQDAYSLFLTSTPLEQKLFKVFQSKPGNVVMLSEIGVE